MSLEQTRARRGYLEHAQLHVAKHAWWYAECPRHGVTDHLGVLGGACAACYRETLIEKGLVKR